MSDIGFQGAADLVATFLGIALILIVMAAVPLGIAVLGSFGVRISTGVRTSAKRLIVFCCLPLVGLIVAAAMMLAH